MSARSVLDIGQWFPPELALGPGELDTDTKERLSARIVAIATARGVPLHVSVAWNALHFDYDPERGSYADVFLEGTLPEVPLGTTTDALPVGALCWVQLGGKEVWAEVVGKDGRPGTIDDGFVAAEVSGAPAIADDDGAVVLREALVVDLNAFGPADDETRKHVDRLIRRGRLDRHGLVESLASYPSIADANEPDRWFYARWLLDHRPDLVRHGPLGVALLDASDDALRAALVNSFDAIESLLTDCDDLARWGDYFFPVAWLDDLDALPGLPLQAADLASILSSLRHVRAIEYVPLEARLDEKIAPLLVDDDRRPDAPASERDPMHGVKWLRTIVTTNRWLADCAAREPLQDGAHVRIDDRFAWGGIWRASPAQPNKHPLHAVPVDVPLGLGSGGDSALATYLELTLEELRARIEEAAQLELPPPEIVPAEDEPADDGIADTFVEAVVTLRAVDVQGELPLPDTLAWLAELDKVSLRLSHDGELDNDQRLQEVQPAHDEAIRRLIGISWPIDFFAGIRVHCIAMRGTSTLAVSTTPLLEPLDGFNFAFDPRVVTSRRAVEVPRLGLVATRIIARHGVAHDDGTRRGDAVFVADHLFGTDSSRALVGIITSVLDDEVARGRIGRVGDTYVVTRHDRVIRRPESWAQRTQTTRVEVRPHWVPGFLRCLPVGWRASATKRAEYAAARAAGEVAGPPELPDGYTWVVGHERGGDVAAYLLAFTDLVDESGAVVDAADALSTSGMDRTERGDA